MTSEQEQRLTQIAQCSALTERLTGLPALVTCAQCILETGWLAHVSGNNCFGIKSYPGVFGRQLLRTREWFTTAELHEFLARGEGRAALPVTPPEFEGMRQLYAVWDWFAIFPSLNDCFAYRARLLLNSTIYRNAVAAYRAKPDIGRFVASIAADYATDGTYAQKLGELIAEKPVLEMVEAARSAAQLLGNAPGQLVVDGAERV